MLRWLKKLWHVLCGASLYTVKPGDTLSAIALEFYGNATQYPRIYEANKDILDNPDKIYPDQVLIIPPR